VRVSVAVGLSEGAFDCEAPFDSDAVGTGVKLGVCELDTLPVSLLLALGEPVPVALGEPVEVAEPVRAALNEPVPVRVNEPVLAPVAEPVPVREPVPVPLDEPVAVELSEPVPVALAEPVLVALDEPVPVTVALDEPVPVFVPVVEGTSTVGCEMTSAAARSTGLMPVEAPYASKKPDVKSESSSGDELPGTPLDCAVLSANTRLEAASFCLPVTSAMLSPVDMAAGMTSRTETPASAVRRRAVTCRRAPVSSTTALWNQMASPGPNAASDVTHCCLCMGYGDATDGGASARRR